MDKRILGRDCLAAIAALCAALFSMSMSGCGYMAALALNSAFNRTEYSQDHDFCHKRCSDLKGDAYGECHKQCMALQERKRREARWEEERNEFQKGVVGKTIKDR